MTKPIDIGNKEVIKILRESLAAMEVKKQNAFKIRAYQNAISAMDNLTSNIQDLWENARLDEVPGVGVSLKNNLDELFKTGKINEFEKLKRGLPAGMFELISLRGVGAKTAFKIADAFKLDNRDTALQETKKMARKGNIRKLPGFGEKSETEILEAIEDMKKHKDVKERLLLIHAEEISKRVLDYMKTADSVKIITVLGSLRRRSETVGDLDFAVATAESELVIDHFIKFPEIKEIISKGTAKASVVLKNDIQVDLMTTTTDAFGALLQHFTGSKQHNIQLRGLALEGDMSLSEKGVKIDGKLEKFSTEKEFYKRIGLDYIPPEIRSGKHEIEAAKKKTLPDLIELPDIKGDIHTHTTFSDGEGTLEEMVSAARAMKYEYIGISDHAPSIQSRGKYEVLGTISKTRDHIEQLNYSLKDIRVLFGYEVNVLVNASMSLPDEILRKLDYVIASIHTGFEQDRDRITKRLIEAIKNPFVNVIGHPSARLINQRDALDVDWEKIFHLALEYNKIIEINAQPSRLDLPHDLVFDAIKSGVKLIIGTDAHTTLGLSAMRYGIDVARRGWCEKSNIINTQTLDKFMENFPKMV